MRSSPRWSAECSSALPENRQLHPRRRARPLRASLDVLDAPADPHGPQRHLPALRHGPDAGGRQPGPVGGGGARRPSGLEASMRSAWPACKRWKCCRASCRRTCARWAGSNSTRPAWPTSRRAINGRVDQVYADFPGTVGPAGRTPGQDLQPRPALDAAGVPYRAAGRAIRRAGIRGSSLSAASRRRLLLWGITEQQIDELAKSRPGSRPPGCLRADRAGR